MEIKIPQEVYDKIMHWINKTDIEVSGFGKVVRDRETNTFAVVDAYLLEQEGGAAHTDIDDKSLARLMYQTKDVEGDLRWWWHSHVKMQTFWSKTDTDTIKELGANGWIVATVFNQKYEYKSALAYVTHSDFGDDVDLYDDIETDIVRSIEQQVIDKWDAEFTKTVKEKKHTPSPSLLTSKTIYPSLGYGDGYSLGGDVYNTQYTPTDADGLLGYGVAVEAQALGMTAEAYCKKLNSRDSKVINSLEDKLVQLDTRGKFERYENIYKSGRM